MNKHEEQASPPPYTNAVGATNNGLCLLSIDGGGVRGLSSLYILRHIMVKVNAQREQRGDPIAKPCDVFDLIGGTSTGGLIAILLGRLEMSVDECIEVYQNWMCEVFKHRDHLLKINTRGQLQHRFSPSPLRKAIERTLAFRNVFVSKLYDDGEERACRSFVVARRVESNHHVLIRDYTMPGDENYDRLTIVESALATSAASTLFPPLEANGKRYVDGALGDNNPTPLVWQTAQDIWAGDDGRLDDRLNCIISIGTGSPKFNSIEASAWSFLSGTLRKIATETEETEQKFAKAYRHLLYKPEQQKYFRFNVDTGLEDVGLKSHEKTNLIDVATSEFLDRTQGRIFELKRCDERLSQQNNVSQEETKEPPIHKFSNIPRKHPYFVGRTELLHLMRELLCPPPDSIHSEPMSCLIYGIGGMGKTQLARAYSDSSSYEYHFFIQAESVAKLTESFHIIAKTFALQMLPNDPNVVQTVKAALEEHEGSWLLIFDNVEDNSFHEVVEAMPSKATKSSAIIVTSQFDDIKHYTKSAISLPSLTEQEGVELLSKCLRQDPKDVAHSDKELLRDISARLGGLPLALAHTGGYMSKSNDELSEFKDFFNDRWERIIYPTKQRIVHQYEYQALAVVWDFALGKLDPDSRKLINILAYLNPEDIDKQWLVRERGQTRDWVEQGLSPEVHVHNLVSSLIDRCLIEVKKSKNSHGLTTSYSIHRSLQIALRLKLDQREKEDERSEVLGHAISIMRRVTPHANELQVPEQSHSFAFTNASPHVLSMCLAFRKAHPAIQGTVELARLFYDVGFHHWAQLGGVSRDGLTLLLTAETILNKLDADEPQLRSDISCMISCLLDLEGAGFVDVIKGEARAEALRRKKELVKTREMLVLAEASSEGPLRRTRNFELTDDKISTNEILYYNSVNDLALSYLQVNNFNGAELLFEKCYTKYQLWGTVEDIPFEYSKYFNNIAAVRMYQGRYDEALSWAEKALVCKEKADGTRKSPRYLWLRYNTTNIKIQAGRYTEALASHLEILREREAICGSRSEHVLQSLYTVGAVNYHLGRLDDAERNLRECLDRAQRTRWATTHALERAQWHLAMTLRRQNKDPAFVEQLEITSRIALHKIVETVKNDPPAYLEHMLADVETHGISLFDWALPFFGNRWTGRELLRVIQRSHGILPGGSDSLAHTGTDLRLV